MMDMRTFTHDGREFEVWEGVYEPAEDSFMLLAEALRHPRSRMVEVGTGCGLIAIQLSKSVGSPVVATDVSRVAIRCARNNATKHCARVEFLLGDLLSPLLGTLDLVLFNPPYLPVEPAGSEERSWAGGKGGREVIDRFLGQLGRYLSPDGLALLVHSSLNDLDKTKAVAGEEGFRVRVLSRERFFFETLYVVGLERVRL
jgi:release factor glutamine methyltransferase